MTDPARACAEEIYGVFWGAINGERHKEIIVSEIMHRLSKHFPPSVPVSRLENILHEFYKQGMQVVIWTGQEGFSFHVNDAHECIYETSSANILDGVAEIQQENLSTKDPILYIDITGARSHE